jgi:hypothetical protein
MIHFFTNVFPVLQPEGFDDVKDPCPVFDGTEWHLFGSAGTVNNETWKIFHATAPQIEGPWTQHPQIDLGLVGSGVAAPGVVFEDGTFHMFIQTEFMRSGGTCEHLVSPDGFAWTRQGTALSSIPGTATRTASTTRIPRIDRRREVSGLLGHGALYWRAAA